MIPQRFERAVQLAAQMAQVADGVHKMGCVIVKNGRFLGKGRNSYSNGSHCEEVALGKNWKSEFDGATLIVVRIRKAQPFGLAKPCKKCAKLIREYGIKNVVYSTNDIDNPMVLVKW